jgi:hypothetical protein
MHDATGDWYLGFDRPLSEWEIKRSYDNADDRQAAVDRVHHGKADTASSEHARQIERKYYDSHVCIAPTTRVCASSGTSV